jgi:hypothetical protein
MWSGPRNISTAMMRSFENRPDTIVEDEPFYAHYLNKTGLNHPMSAEIINSQNLNWIEISNRLCSKIHSNKTVWYQKHMAQHNLENCDLDWTKNLTNCFLIRDPKEVINSYSKKIELHSVNQLGFKQQLELFNFLKENNNSNPPIVINSKDILINPKKTLTQFCNLVGIPFFEEMLNWPSGTRKSDGIWGMHWYKNVVSSTEFNSYIPKEINLPNKYHSIYEECNDSYLQLNNYKIQIP